MGTKKRAFIPAALAAGLVLIAAAPAGSGGASPDGTRHEPAPSGEKSPEAGKGVPSAGGGSAAGKEPLEIVETRGGKHYRGRVVGYDAGTRSYILLVDEIRLSVSEAEILTIRSQGDAEPARVEPPASPAPAPEAVPAGSPAPPRKEEAAREGPGPRPPAPAPTAVKEAALAGEVEPVTLESLVRDIRTLPSPRTPEAAQAFSGALDLVRAGEPLSAVEPLKRAVLLAGDCPTPALVLAAIRMDVEKNPEEAWPLLTSAGAGAGIPAPVKPLLARAALDLGYRKLSHRFQAEAIEARFEGAEREYRLFRFFRDRDPDRSRKAWLEYRRLDPGRERVSTAEGPRLRQAVEALEKGAATEATSILARLCGECPWMEEEARPLLQRALTARAERAQAAGRHEVALGDVRALAEESPDRRGELEPREREIEAAWVKARLQGASGAAGLETAVRSLSFSIPDLKERFGPPVAAACLEAARGGQAREGFDAAAQALKAGSAFGAVPDAGLLEAMTATISKDAAAGDLARARGRLKRLEDLGAKGEALDRVRREIERVSEGPRSAPEAPGKPGDVAGPASIPHFPLVVGSQWRYLYGDGSREVLSLVGIDLLKDGRTAYRFTSELLIGDARIPYQKTGYFSGPCFHLGSSSRALGADPVLKAPAARGTHWAWRKGDIACEREYAAVDARISCRAGTFEDCLKVKATSRLDAGGAKSRPIVQWFYYASGVGLVKIEGETPFDGRELEEYRIGGGPALPSPALAAPAGAGAPKAAKEDRDPPNQAITQGASTQGASTQGASTQGAATQGAATAGEPRPEPPPQGTAPEPVSATPDRGSRIKDSSPESEVPSDARSAIRDPQFQEARPPVLQGGLGGSPETKQRD